MNVALSNYYTLTAEITPEQMGETVGATLARFLFSLTNMQHKHCTCMAQEKNLAELWITFPEAKAFRTCNNGI